jgi:endonuclease/exonuclease/phosphatase family metal-dependent hydrolase
MAMPAHLSRTPAVLAAVVVIALCGVALHGCGAEADGKADAADTAGRIAQIAPMLADFPIIGLQESWIDKNQAVIDAANSHQTKLAFADKLNAEKVYGSGLAALINRPVAEVVRQHYAECNGFFDAASDCLASKGVMMTRLHLGGAAHCTLDLYNTHLEAGGKKADEAVRSGQVGAILALMATASAGRAVLLLGDTNLRPSDPPDLVELERFAAAGLADACTVTACPEPDHIDRFLYKSGDKVQIEAKTWTRETRFVDKDGVDLSDHPALSTRLRWTCAP